MTYKAIADTLGLKNDAVGCVLRGKTWVHIPDDVPASG
jgi:hypothetical protein